LGLETEEERKERQWRELDALAVDFSALNPEARNAARGSWVAASEEGSRIYIYEETAGDYRRFFDPADALEKVQEERAVAVRVGSQAEVRAQVDIAELNKALAPLRTLLKEPIAFAAPPAGGAPSELAGQTNAQDAAPPDQAVAAQATSSSPDGGGGNPLLLPGVSMSAAARGGRELLDLLPSPALTPAVTPERIGNALPADALQWGDDGTKRLELLERPEFEDGRVPADFGMTAPEDAKLGQIDPFGPTVGEYGHVATHDQHQSKQNAKRKADYVDPKKPSPGTRISEREHGIAGAQLEEVGRRADGTSSYTHYDDDVTVWTERNTALNKTHANRGGATADNAVTDAMKARTAAKQGNDLVDTAVDARNNFQRAVQATNSAVPPRSVDIAVFLQMSNMSGAQTTAEVAKELPPGAADDIDKVISQLDNSDAFHWAGVDAPHVPDLPVPGRGAKEPGALKAGGKVALEVLGPLGTGLSVYSFATAKGTEERILTGADLAADLVGYAGPVGGSFSISYGVTRAVDEGIGWASKEYLGKDLAPTSVIAEGMVEVDQALTRLWADPSKPLYSQTIGWKIAGWLH
jgi:hypothetical protein